MEIKQKVIKEIEEIVGYKCDICNKDINVDVNFSSLYLNTVEYSELSGGWGERDITYRKHICSVDCLKRVINEASFGANIFLSRDLIEELVNKL